jgi:uridine phosphorylase
LKSAIGNRSLTSPPVSGTIHIHPTAALAERVLLPGDPGRALLLSQSLLTGPKMFNHNRGLWGYTGLAADGHPLTIQSTGMGGPSAAIVVTELHELGARRLVRVGTCGALAGDLALGELVVVSAALADDGTSRSLGAGPTVPASPELLARLATAADGSAHRCMVASTDLFYDGPEGAEERWLAAGAAAVEMEAATLFALAARRGFQAGAVLIVTDLLIPSRRRIDADTFRVAEQRAGELGAAALAI